MGERRAGGEPAASPDLARWAETLKRYQSVDPGGVRKEHWTYLAAWPKVDEVDERDDPQAELRLRLEVLETLEVAHAFPGVGVVGHLQDEQSRSVDNGVSQEDNDACAARANGWGRAAIRWEDPGHDPCPTVPAGVVRHDWEVLHLQDPQAPTDLAAFDGRIVRTTSVEGARHVLEANPLVQAILVDAARTGAEAELDALTRLRFEVPARVLHTHEGAADALTDDRHLVVDDQGEDLRSKVLQPDFDRRSAAPWLTALAKWRENEVVSWHSLPIGRGRSLDLVPDGDPAFRALLSDELLASETSGTLDPLDTIFTPKRSIADARKLAADAFGPTQVPVPEAAQAGTHSTTHFVTNGTSTANKIVAQAAFEPGKVVIIDRECHKSWHYALALAGAHVRFVEGYPIAAHGMAGGVAREHLITAVKEVGTDLSAVVLTNCTFDGVVTDPKATMEAVLAATSVDPVFVWDEAWYGSARFEPELRERTAMVAAKRMVEERATHPGERKLRVYSTQSTHKTLSSLRQGSMIHIFDEAFPKERFDDAFMVHTSTSPSYLLLASLDAARRQVHLYGSFLVTRSHRIAALLRADLTSGTPQFPRVAEVLVDQDQLLAPACLPPARANALPQVAADEFVLDPTRITLDAGPFRMAGPALQEELTKQHVQLNKKTMTSVLLNIHIGTSLDDVNSLLATLEELLNVERDAQPPSADPLPSIPAFAPGYRVDGRPQVGDLREAYLDGLFPGRKRDRGDQDATVERPEAKSPPEQLVVETLDLNDALDRVREGEPLVSATFVSPYPPGFPVLVPGSVVTDVALEYLIKVRESKIDVHGLEAAGLRVLASVSDGGGGS